MTWTNLSLLHHSPVLEDRVVCAIADASVDEVYDVSLIEIVNSKFDWITPEQVQKFIRAAAKAAITDIRRDTAREIVELALQKLYGPHQPPTLQSFIASIRSTYGLTTETEEGR